MIAERYITEWSDNFPWTKNSFVEQDMVICRALVDIFSDPYLSNALAFRGGTAIHKLHFSPQVRYSEDIDLVQVEPGPVKPITERLSEVLSWLPRMTSEIRRFGFRMKFRADRTDASQGGSEHVRAFLRPGICHDPVLHEEQLVLRSV